MACRQQLLEKVKKLLALAERGGTPEESANAAAKAQAILERYNLDMAALDLEGEPEPIGYGEPLEAMSRMPTWRWELAVVVARANGCRILGGSGWDTGRRRYLRRLDILGRPSDVAVARYFYAYLRAEIDRLVRKTPRPAWTDAGPSAWSNAFRRGVVDTIGRRLEEARRKEAVSAKERYAGDSAALMRISECERKGDQVDAWIDENIRVRAKHFGGIGSWDGFSAGREAGKSVDLGSSKLGGSTRGSLGS